MYTATALLVLAAASASAFSLAERAPVASLNRRAVAQGWSVVSDSAVDGTTDCGGGYFCPSSLTCFDAKNSEVASCCESNNACVGQVEGSPSCADAAWTLYSGVDNNGFCCEAGKVGVVDRQSRSVSCVDSGDVGSQSTAEVIKSGAAAPSKTSSSAASSSSSSSSAAASATSTASTTSTTSMSASSVTSGTSSTAVVVATGNSSSSTMTLAQPTTGSNTTSGSTATGTDTSAADKKQMAMGMMAIGLMVVAAL